MARDELISKAWLEAAADLGIRVVAPFELQVEGGARVSFEAHIPDFGGPKGTVAAGADNRIAGVREQNGYFPSDLGSPYRRYIRQLFIDTLLDWGWSGEPGAEPPWYAGERWL